MATPALVPPASEHKGIQPMKALVEGIFPPNFGDPNAESIAQQNLKKMDVTIPTLKEDPKNPAPVVPAQIQTPEPQKVVPATPEPAKEATPKELALEANPLEDALLKAVEPIVEDKPTTETTPEVTPVAEATAPDETIPKTAKEQREALIKMRRILGEKEKKIKELEAKGSIDVAATATEPLRQRIAQLEAENAQALNQAASVKIENHPEVQRQYIKPMQLAENFIKETAKNNEGVSARELFQIAQEPDHIKRKAAVKAACPDLDADDMIQVRQAVDAIHDLGDGLEKIKANASNIAAGMEQKAKEVQAAQQAAFRAQSIKAHDDTFEDFAKNPLIKHFADTNPEFKKQIENIREIAKQAEVDTSWLQNDKVRAKAIQNGLAYEPVTKALQGQIAQLIKDKKDLLAQNQNLKRGSISTQPRQATFNAPVTDKPISVESIVKGVMASAR